MLSLKFSSAADLRLQALGPSCIVLVIFWTLTLPWKESEGQKVEFINRTFRMNAITCFSPFTWHQWHNRLLGRSQKCLLSESQKVEFINRTFRMNAITHFSPFMWHQWHNRLLGSVCCWKVRKLES